MEEKVLVAGASGALGLEISKILKSRNIPIRALVHSSDGASKVSPYTSDIYRADASEGSSEIKDITQNVTTIVSAMGKSVSLFSGNENSFMENDFFANNNLLDDAVKNGVKRFVYVSIKGADAEEAREFEVAKAHRKFEEALQASGLDYTIVRPVGFFSGLNDLAIMAKRNVIPIIGEGKAKTNSIHQKDLATFVMQYLNEGPETIEVGGPLIHTRLEMAEMIKEKIGGQILKVPEKLAELGMFLPEMVSDNISSKLEYFKFVTSNDMIGEKTGSITFQQYLDDLDLNDLP
ncbi:3-beta hydroxysteroid dehydrogenase [Salinimicrobium marinum]|uniref:3-beta hydroxysteroid dehydrogenase n=1 Tax=Salinimicrobium marinum TaxID=680283 RepID=A0A918VW88_9FLAO|nr:NAD(P)H-binding protein [Salinimicrobium marinum]GHA29282.1 3-beta hydroxysteroid dehydrogenase [Salinimicrobium marinum]